jgi:hypothetical protein
MRERGRGAALCRGVVLLVVVLFNTPVEAQGFLTWVGDRVGLGNVGRVIDNANRAVKESIPEYGRAEEAVTRAGRQAFSELTVESTAPLLKNLILASRDNALNAGAGPLPGEVVAEFSGFFGPDVLSAYWRIGQGHELSLQANSFRFGDRAAIALDTVLVFRSRNEINSIWLWAHELAHIEQYRRWGVDDFTKRYIRDHESIEAEASQRANAFMAWRVNRAAAYASQPGPATMPMPMPPVSNGSVCVTAVVACPWLGPVGFQCACASYWGMQPGTIR